MSSLQKRCLVHKNSPASGQWCRHDQNSPLNLFPPIPGSMFCVIYLTRDSTAQCVCSPGAGFNPPEFWSPCGLPVSCCLAMSVVQSRNSKRLVAPLRVYVCICMDSAGPAWSSLAQDLYGSGRHESGICTFPSPGPWRARRLDSTVWTLVFGKETTTTTIASSNPNRDKFSNCYIYVTCVDVRCFS